MSRKMFIFKKSMMPIGAAHAQPREICWWRVTGEGGFWMAV